MFCLQHFQIILCSFKFLNIVVVCSFNWFIFFLNIITLFFNCQQLCIFFVDVLRLTTFDILMSALSKYILHLWISQHCSCLLLQLIHILSQNYHHVQIIFCCFKFLNIVLVSCTLFTTDFMYPWSKLLQKQCYFFSVIFKWQDTFTCSFSNTKAHWNYRH